MNTAIINTATLKKTHQAGKHLEQDGRVAVVDDAASAHVSQALGTCQLHLGPLIPLREGDDVPYQVAAIVRGAGDLQCSVLVVEDKAGKALQRWQLDIFVRRAQQQVQSWNHVHLDQRVLMLGRLGENGNT